MKGKKCAMELIVAKLREAEVLPGRGSVLAEGCRQPQITDANYCRWRRDYRGLRID